MRAETAETAETENDGMETETRIVKDCYAGQRLDKCASELFHKSRAALQRFLEEGALTVNGQIKDKIIKSKQAICLRSFCLK